MPEILNNSEVSSLALSFSCSLVLNFKLYCGIFNAVLYCIKVVYALLEANNAMHFSLYIHISLCLNYQYICTVFQKEDWLAPLDDVELLSKILDNTITDF